MVAKADPYIAESPVQAIQQQSDGAVIESPNIEYVSKSQSSNGEDGFALGHCFGVFFASCLATIKKQLPL